ncbi:nuclear transport factor 2 family protein [Sphingobium phenoxybenzoativorans]|uniref:Nuclear transport factor 2 family protein n=1 Tax=Sphingobium phenoxybenzoativorans TaxID=1592790 RepID=A0A975Q2B1_9SPHN|nr:nuclear transport factor 2 family protein [Sphingobium phenoxybenzoativorans]QUT06820.1 nuclear transport factor 2 family protein [Sphingobium phenoxybenzoativorans]
MEAEDYRQIEELLYRSFWLIDHGRAEKCAELFTKDGALTFGPGAPSPGTISGADIAISMSRRQAQSAVTSRHVLSNILIEDDGDGKATMRSLLTLFRTESNDMRSEVKSVADIEDIVAYNGTGWKIEHRTITPIFSL